MEGEEEIRTPIRGIFAGCASAMTATASNTTTTRIDGTAAFFIAHLVSSVIYHADRGKEKCNLRGKATTFSSRKGPILRRRRNSRVL
jgi:hypothetical protein